MRLEVRELVEELLLLRIEVHVKLLKLILHLTSGLLALLLHGHLVKLERSHGIEGSLDGEVEFFDEGVALDHDVLDSRFDVGSLLGGEGFDRLDGVEFSFQKRAEGFRVQ